MADSKLTATLDLDVKPFIDAIKQSAVMATTFTKDVAKTFSESLSGIKIEPAKLPVPEIMSANIPPVKVPIEFNAKELADKFNLAKTGLDSLMRTQALALAQMKLTGQEGTDAYKKLEAEIKATEAELGKMNNAQKGVKISTQAQSSKQPAQPSEAGGVMTGFMGGVIATKAISMVVGSFSDIMERGKKSYEMTEQLELSFKQAKLTGADLDSQLARTSSFAGELSNRFAVGAGKIREYAAQAAFIGGATGKANEDITTLAIGIEKASKGMISGDMVIRTFTKGLNDPEAVANLRSLKMRFPELATALKDVKDPAEMTAVAMKTLAPTFQTLSEQAQGPLGSIDRLQNSFGAMKATIGKVIIEGIAPLIQSFSANIIPVLQWAVGGFKSLSTVLQPLAPILAIAGTAAAGLFGTLLAFKGISYLRELAKEGYEFASSIITKLIPSLAAQTIAMEAETGAELVNAGAKKAGLLSTLTQTIGTMALSVWTGIQSTATWLATTAQWALNAAFLASPIGWIVLGIAAIIGVMILLYNNVEQVRKFFEYLWQMIKVGATFAWEIIKKLGEILYNIGKILYEVVIAPFKILWAIIKSVGEVIANLVKDLFGFADGGGQTIDILGGMKSAFDWVMNSLNKFLAGIQGAKAAVSSFIDSVTTAIGRLVKLDFSGAFDIMSNAGTRAGEAFNQGMNDALAEKVETEAVEQKAVEIDKKKKDYESKISELKTHYEKVGLTKEVKTERSSLTTSVSKSNELSTEEKDQYEKEINEIFKKEKSNKSSIDKQANEENKLNELLIKQEEQRQKIIEEQEKKTAENQIKNLENTIKTINNDESKSQSQKIYETAVIEQKILDIKKNTELGEAEYKNQVDKIKQERELIETAATEESTKKIKNKYLKDYADIELNQKLTQSEKIQKLEELNQITLSDIQSKTKSKDINTKIDTARTNIKENYVKTTETTNVSINTKYEEEGKKNDEKTNKEIDEAVIKETKESLESKIKLITQNNNEQINKANELKKQLLAIEFKDISGIQKGDITDPVKLAQYQEYQNKITEINNESEKKRIEIETDETNKKKDIAIYDATIIYQKELQLAGDNVDLRLAAEKKFNVARYKITDEYLKDTNSIYKTSMNIIEGMKEYYNDKESTNENKAKKDKQEQVQKDIINLEESLKKGEIKYREYQEKLISLNKQRQDAEIDNEKKKNVIIEGLNKGLAKSFENLYKQKQDDVKKDIENYSHSMTLRNKIDNDLQKIENKESKEYQNKLKEKEKADSESTDYTNKLYVDSAITIGAATMQALASGKNTGKAFISAAFDMLQSMVPIWSAQILAGSLATPQSIMTAGGWGLAEWAATTILIEGAVSAARGALGAEEGNMPGTKEAKHGKGATDTTLMWVNPKTEAILPAKMTAKETPLLNYLFKTGNSSKDYFNQMMSSNIETNKEKSSQSHIFNKNSLNNLVSSKEITKNIETNKELSIFDISKTDNVKNIIQNHKDRIEKLSLFNNIIQSKQSSDNIKEQLFKDFTNNYSLSKFYNNELSNNLIKEKNQNSQFTSNSIKESILSRILTENNIIRANKSEILQDFISKNSSQVFENNNNSNTKNIQSKEKHETFKDLIINNYVTSKEITEKDKSEKQTFNTENLLKLRDNYQTIQNSFDLHYNPAIQSSNIDEMINLLSKINDKLDLQDTRKINVKSAVELETSPFKIKGSDMVSTVIKHHNKSLTRF